LDYGRSFGGGDLLQESDAGRQDVMSDWDEVPWGLRVKIQGLNFVLYVAGVSLRFFFFGLVFLGVNALYKHHWIQAAICLICGLGFMWEDSQRAGRPREWLSSKYHTLD
jgi:hypothetical protein